MKTYLCLLFISLFAITSCSLIKNRNVFRKDQFNAINDYLESKSNGKDIIVIREKISTNATIKLFRGEYLTINYPDTIYTTREGGIAPPLFNEKDWLIMKMKYWNEKDSIYGKSGYWSKNDFKYKKIEFVNGPEFWEKVKLNINNWYTEQELNVFSFSIPIYYRKKYLTFYVGISSNHDGFYSGNMFIVVMKKAKGKWIVIQQADKISWK